MKIKFNYSRIKIKQKDKIKRRFNFLSIVIDFSFYRQFEIRILNPFIERQWKHKTGKMDVHLMPGYHRKVNKIIDTNIFRLFFVEMIYIKNRLIKKCNLRKIYKRMGYLK